MCLCLVARHGHSRGHPRLAAVSLSDSWERYDRLWRALFVSLVENVRDRGNRDRAFPIFWSPCEECLDAEWLFAICILFTRILSRSFKTLLFFHLCSLYYFFFCAFILLVSKQGQGRTENDFKSAQRLAGRAGLCFGVLQHIVQRKVLKLIFKLRGK